MGVINMSVLMLIGVVAFFLGWFASERGRPGSMRRIIILSLAVTYVYVITLLFLLGTGGK